MAPAAAVAYSIYMSVPDARQALPLSVGLALIACLCFASCPIAVAAQRHAISASPTESGRACRASGTEM